MVIYGPISSQWMQNPFPGMYMRRGGVGWAWPALARSFQRFLAASLKSAQQLLQFNYWKFLKTKGTGAPATPWWTHHHQTWILWGISACKKCNISSLWQRSPRTLMTLIFSHSKSFSITTVSWEVQQLQSRLNHIIIWETLSLWPSVPQSNSMCHTAEDSKRAVGWSQSSNDSLSLDDFPTLHFESIRRLQAEAVIFYEFYR